VVSAANAFFGGLRPRQLAAYLIAQVAGGGIGVIIANLMFALPPVTLATHVRSGPALWLSEVVATFGLLLVIFGVVRSGRLFSTPCCRRSASGSTVA
jgi:glycerol uptake facilitator-like aquaporin